MAYQGKSDAEWDKINYKKERSIAFFNATKAAIEICRTRDVSVPRDCIIEERDFLIEEWEKWYKDEQVVKAGNTPLPPPVRKEQAQDSKTDELNSQRQEEEEQEKVNRANNE